MILLWQKKQHPDRHNR